MQMGYDFENERQSAGSGPRIGRFAGLWPARDKTSADGLASTAPAHPDWAGLRARFLAIHALHRSLAAFGPVGVPAGSFMLAAEAVLGDCRSAPAPINPVYSGYGKVTSSIHGLVAASPTPGDRGLL